MLVGSWAALSNAQHGKEAGVQGSVGSHVGDADGSSRQEWGQEWHELRVGMRTRRDGREPFERGIESPVTAIY